MAVDELTFDPNTATLERWSDLEVLRLACIDRASVCGATVPPALVHCPIRDSATTAETMRLIASTIIGLVPKFVDFWPARIITTGSGSLRRKNFAMLSVAKMAKDRMLVHPSNHATFDPDNIAVYREYLANASWYLKRMRYVDLRAYSTCRRGTADYSSDDRVEFDPSMISWSDRDEAIPTSINFRMRAWHYYYYSFYSNSDRWGEQIDESSGHQVLSLSRIVVRNPAALRCRAFFKADYPFDGPEHILNFFTATMQTTNCISYESSFTARAKYAGFDESEWKFGESSTVAAVDAVGRFFDGTSVDLCHGSFSGTGVGTFSIPTGLYELLCRNVTWTEDGGLESSIDASQSIREIQERGDFRPTLFDRETLAYDNQYMYIDREYAFPDCTSGAITIDPHGSCTLHPDGVPIPACSLPQRPNPGNSTRTDLEFEQRASCELPGVFGDYGPFYPHLPTDN